MVNLGSIKTKNPELGQRLMEVAAYYLFLVEQDNVNLDDEHRITANFGQRSIIIYDFSVDTSPFSPKRLWENDLRRYTENGRLASSSIVGKRFGYCLYRSLPDSEMTSIERSRRSLSFVNRLSQLK